MNYQGMLILDSLELLLLGQEQQFVVQEKKKVGPFPVSIRKTGLKHGQALAITKCLSVLPSTLQ